MVTHLVMFSLYLFSAQGFISYNTKSLEEKNSSYNVLLLFL